MASCLAPGHPTNHLCFCSCTHSTHTQHLTVCPPPHPPPPRVRRSAGLRPGPAAAAAAEDDDAAGGSGGVVTVGQAAAACTLAALCGCLSAGVALPGGAEEAGQLLQPLCCVFLWPRARLGGWVGGCCGCWAGGAADMCSDAMLGAGTAGHQDGCSTEGGRVQAVCYLCRCQCSCAATALHTQGGEGRRGTPHFLIASPGPPALPCPLRAQAPRCTGTCARTC